MFKCAGDVYFSYIQHPRKKFVIVFRIILVLYWNEP